jgi:hypothetical protein
MKFGIIKSKIENVLLESYKNNTFKNEVKNFKKLVLENKNVSKLYYLYDELNSNKGLDKDIANDYVNECITIYENIINKLNQKDINNLKQWLSKDTSKNIYENIDGLFNTDVLSIDKKIKSRKQIIENLQKSPEVIKESVINIPFKSMVSIANKTMSNYISSLNENEKNELVSLLSESDDVLKEKYENEKSEVVGKLNKLVNEETDSQTKQRITETLEKITNDEYDKVNYYRLNKLNQNI